MDRTRPPPPFASVSPERIAPIRAVLRDTGFNGQTVADTVQVEGGAPRPARQLPVLLRLTAGGRPVDTLIRLFVMGVTVERDVVAAAVSPTDPTEWAALGLVALEGDQVRPLVTMRPWDDLVVASDRRPHGAGLPPDYVMGISPSTLMLAQLTVREGAATMLDVGTGSGFHGLVAASRGTVVTATDVNPRALAFARLNAALNELDMELAEGSFYEPVAGRRFDLIVSNAPFIIAPSPTHLFLHGGLADDGVGEALARGAPDHLTPGGYCQFLAHWLVAGDDWTRRLAGWFSGSGCDTWVMEVSTSTIEEYAAQWLEVDDEETELVPAFDAWMEYFAGKGAERIGYGLITMRRSEDGSSQLFLEDGPASVSALIGEYVARGLGLRTQLAGMDDDAVLATRPALSRDVRLEQVLLPGDGGWEAAGFHLHRTAGLLYEGRIDGPGARLLGRCDGSRPLSELLAELAAELDAPADAVVADALPTVRRMYEQGFLELA